MRYLPGCRCHSACPLSAETASQQHAHGRMPDMLRPRMGNFATVSMTSETWTYPKRSALDGTMYTCSAEEPPRPAPSGPQYMPYYTVQYILIANSPTPFHPRDAAPHARLPTSNTPSWTARTTEQSILSMPGDMLHAILYLHSILLRISGSVRTSNTPSSMAGSKDVNSTTDSSQTRAPSVLRSCALSTPQTPS